MESTDKGTNRDASGPPEGGGEDKLVDIMEKSKVEPMAGDKGTSSSTEQNDATSGFESAYSWLRCHYYGGKDAAGSGGGNDPTAKGMGTDVERGGSNNTEQNDATNGCCSDYSWLRIHYYGAHGRSTSTQ